MNGVSLKVTYNPALKNLSRDKKKPSILYADEQVKKLFSPAQFVSFRKSRNLKSYLVASTLVRENLVLESVRVSVA